MFNIQKIRSGFPFLATTPTPVYLDNAATTPKPQPVLDAIQSFYIQTNGNPGRGNHQLARTANTVYEKARADVASFVHATKPAEIVFVPNATAGINLLATALGKSTLSANDVVLTTQLEHHSNLLPWITATKETKSHLKFFTTSATGTLTPPTGLNQIPAGQVKVFALTHVSNVLGNILPVNELIQQVRQNHPDAMVVLDAAQSIAHLPINVQKLDVDFMVFSGHKLYGPMGIGVIYGRQSSWSKLPPFFSGGGMVETADWHSFTSRIAPYQFEAGTPNVAGAVGLATAVNWINQIGLENIYHHEQSLTNYLLTKLTSANINGLTIYGPHSNSTQRVGLVSLNINSIAAEDLATWLDDERIMVRSGHHCAIPLHQKVLGTTSSLRISLGVYNSTDEIDLVVEKLLAASKMLR